MGTGTAIPLLVDTGSTVLILPRWEDISGLPGAAANYQVLGHAHEPWGCPAKVVRGPIELLTTTGAVFRIDDCVFYSCTGDKPLGGRTANFGAGCLVPWPTSGWNGPLPGVTMKSPLTYCRR